MVHYFRTLWGVDEGTTYKCEAGRKLRVGRDPSNEVHLDADAAVSAFHAVLKESQGVLYVSDQKSTNGTFLDGRRAEPQTNYVVPDFVTFGTTSFVRTSRIPRINTKNRVEVADASSWQALPIFKSALSFRGDSGFIGSCHLFLGLLQGHWTEVEPFFSGIGLETSFDVMVSKVADSEFFVEPNQWLNHSIRTSKTRAEIPSVITPLAQLLLQEYMAVRDPIKFLGLFINDDFSLVHALLQWQSTQGRWQTAYKSMTPGARKTVVIRERNLRELLIYKNLWKECAGISATGHIPLLVGSLGIGKSYIFRRMAGKHTEQLLKPPLRSETIIVKDPKEYLLFHPVMKLDGFVRELALEMKNPNLILLDHVGLLVEQIKNQGGDILPLATQITNRGKNLVLACQSKHLRLVESELTSVRPLDLDAYLMQHLYLIHEELLDDFEEAVGLKLGAQARAFFTEQVCASEPQNIRYLSEFLGVCRQRYRDLVNTPISFDGKTRSIGLMSEAIFRDVFEERGGKSCQTNNPAIAEVSPEEDLLLTLERFLYDSSLKIVKVPFRYANSNGSYRDDGLLSREQKLKILRLHILKVMTIPNSAFTLWFSRFWEKFSPEALRKSNPFSPPSTLWREYEQMAKHVNADEQTRVLLDVCCEMWMAFQLYDGDKENPP